MPATRNAEEDSCQKSLKRRAVLVGNLAHFVHDGFTDMLYVFFPIWQAQWSLSFMEVGLLKTLVSGSTAVFQIPSGLLANRVGSVKLLAAGTAVTSLAIMLSSHVTAPAFLGLLLILAGMGSSVQHPLSSALISDVYCDNKARRTALSAFNFVGDLGKLALPTTAAFLISRFQWQTASRSLATFGFLVFFILLLVGLRITSSPAVLPGQQNRKEIITGNNPVSHTLLLGRNGYAAFWSLSAIGAIDGATRMAFLTFFPFLLHDKGAEVTTVGFALTLIFAGGAAGKLACGILATRAGILRSVILTESMTALCIFGMIVLPLGASLLLAPVLGIALNGTSSVLYGSVPELVAEKDRAQAFALFYTVVLGAGAMAPSVYGLFSDLLGIDRTLAIVSAIALATIPLTIPLRGKFH